MSERGFLIGRWFLQLRALENSHSSSERAWEDLDLTVKMLGKKGKAGLILLWKFYRLSQSCGCKPPLYLQCRWYGHLSQ
jgi:hypothetical protein